MHIPETEQLSASAEQIEGVPAIRSKLPSLGEEVVGMAFAMAGSKAGAPATSPPSHQHSPVPTFSHSFISSTKHRNASAMPLLSFLDYNTTLPQYYNTLHPHPHFAHTHAQRPLTPNLARVRSSDPFTEVKDVPMDQLEFGVEDWGSFEVAVSGLEAQAGTKVRMAAAAKVLGVSVDDDPGDVKRVYRKLIATEHPDRNPDASIEKFNAIKEAYEFMSDRGGQSGATFEGLGDKAKRDFVKLEGVKVGGDGKAGEDSKKVEVQLRSLTIYARIQNIFTVRRRAFCISKNDNQSVYPKQWINQSTVLYAHSQNTCTVYCIATTTSRRATSACRAAHPLPPRPSRRSPRLRRRPRRSRSRREHSICSSPPRRRVNFFFFFFSHCFRVA